MRPTLLLLLALALLVRPAPAQSFRQEAWYEGKVVLDTDDTLAGNVRFDLTENLLQLARGNEVKAFSARKVYSFHVYDKLRTRTRNFYTLPYANPTGYEVPTFFELLVQGPLTLLCREKLVVENVPVYGYGGNRGYGGLGGLGGFGQSGYTTTRTRLAFDYFFGYPTGKIRPFEGRRNDFYYLAPQHQGQVEQFVREYKLRYDDPNDLIKIVSYYNYLETN